MTKEGSGGNETREGRGRDEERGGVSVQSHAQCCAVPRRCVAAQRCVVTRESPARGIVRTRSLCIVYHCSKK